MATYIQKMPFFEKLSFDTVHECIKKKQLDIIAYDRGSVISNLNRDMVSVLIDGKLVLREHELQRPD